MLCFGIIWPSSWKTMTPDDEEELMWHPYLELPSKAKAPFLQTERMQLTHSNIDAAYASALQLPAVPLDSRGKMLRIRGIVWINKNLHILCLHGIVDQVNTHLNIMSRALDEFLASYRERNSALREWAADSLALTDAEVTERLAGDPTNEHDNLMRRAIDPYMSVINYRRAGIEILKLHTKDPLRKNR